MRHQRGFTLIELSIVLVIIGLLIGGVTIARSLIEVAQLRKVISEVEGYRMALTSFKSQYEYWPGDIPNARDMGLNTGMNVGTAGTGDGFILHRGPSGPFESYSAWGHLYNAGLTTFLRDPNYITANNNDFPGRSVPRAAHDGETGYKLITAGGWWTLSDNRNVILLAAQGGALTLGDYRWTGGAIRPVDALAIDAKMDDGRPTDNRVAKVFAENGLTKDTALAQTCITGGEYDTTQTGRNCTLSFEFSR